MHFTTATLLALALAGTSNAAPTSKQTRSISKRALPKLGGFDFGCGTDGTCSSGGYVAPSDGFKAQIAYFTGIGANLFRIPVGWQYLVGSTVGGALDQTFFALYDAAMQNCLASGSYCIIDPHNYARWNGAIIGTSGAPTGAQFASFWGELAGKYATEDHVIFSLMNEPHDLTDVQAWADIMQLAVTAIRGAGATSQYIILNGNDWTHGAGWTSGTDDPILKIADADGSNSMLLLDVHEYLDSDDSGTQTVCSTDNVALFQGLQTYFAGIGRTGIVTETGVHNDATCIKDLDAELSTIMSSANLAGFAAWGAGLFDSSYALYLYPANDVDTGALAPNFPGASAGGSEAVVTSASISSVAASATSAVASEASSVASASSSSVVATSVESSAADVTVTAVSSSSAVEVAPTVVASVSALPVSSATVTVVSSSAEASSAAPTLVTLSASASTCGKQRTVTVTVQPSSASLSVPLAGNLATGGVTSVAGAASTSRTRTRSRHQRSSSAGVPASSAAAAISTSSDAAPTSSAAAAPVVSAIPTVIASASSTAEEVVPTTSVSAGDLAVTGGATSAVATASASDVAAEPVSASASSSAPASSSAAAAPASTPSGAAAACPASALKRKRHISPAEAVGRSLM